MAEVHIPPPPTKDINRYTKDECIRMRKQGHSPAKIAKIMKIDERWPRYWIYGGDGKGATGRRKYKYNQSQHWDWYTYKARSWHTSLSKIGQCPSALQIRVWLLRQPDYCCYCGVKLTSTNVQMDHAMPHSRGGSNDFNNLVLACKACNQAKGNMSYPEYCSLLGLIEDWDDGGKNLLTRLRAGTLAYRGRR